MSVIIKGMDKPDKCRFCPLSEYAWEDGRMQCKACNEIVAEVPYEDRLLDSALDNIEVPDFCPIIEVKAPLNNLVDIEDVENMLDHAATIFDGEYGGYCTEDVRLSEIPRIAEGADS